MKTKSPKCWYVVADAGRAAAYVSRKTGPGYDQVASWASDLILPEDQRPQFTDRPGRVFDSLGGNRHAAETVSPAELAKRDFGRTLARALDKARADGAFEALVLFAAPRLLHELREHLDEATARTIARSEAKDLTKLPRQELFDAFDATGLVAAARARPRPAGGSRR
jgi:protein required for attachment to host cells